MSKSRNIGTECKEIRRSLRSRICCCISSYCKAAGRQNSQGSIWEILMAYSQPGCCARPNERAMNIWALRSHHLSVLTSRPEIETKERTKRFRQSTIFQHQAIRIRTPRTRTRPNECSAFASCCSGGPSDMCVCLRTQRWNNVGHTLMAWCPQCPYLKWFSQAAPRPDKAKTRISFTFFVTNIWDSASLDWKYKYYSLNIIL